MSRLDELIAELCPDGVEYKKVGEIADYEQPSKYLVKSTDYNDDFEIPVLTAGQTFILGYTNEIEGIYSASKDKPVIIFDDFTGAFKWVDFPFKAKSSAMKMITAKENVLIRYLYHLMGFLNYSSDEHKRLWISVYSELQVPVPPLEVQREIVHVLDSFTLLTAELTAELTARKKQYGYYRDNLLSFSGNTDVKNVPLGDIAKFVYGYTDKAKETGSARFVRITDISEDGRLNPYDAKYVDLTEESKKYLLAKGDLLLARTGATYGKTLYFESDEPAVYASFLIKIILDNSIIKNRYYWHFSKSSLYWKQAERYVSKGGQQQFNTNAVSRVKVPVPSLEVQDKIIYVLDNFDAICTDLNIGLPAEIEARQKQYEYYRDLLLTFAETGSTLMTDRQTDRAERN